MHPAVETQTFLIPSIKLDQNTIFQLAEIIEKIAKEIEHKKFDPQAVSNDAREFLQRNPNFMVRGSGRRIDAPNLASLKQFRFPEKVEEIVMRGAGLTGTVHVNLDCRPEFFQNNFVTVSGVNTIWVNGTVRTIEEVLQRNKTRNHLFYEKPGAALDVAVGLLLTWLLFKSLRQFLGVGPNTNMDWLFGFGFVGTIVTLGQWNTTERLMRSMFPYIQIGDIRGLVKKLRWFLGAIIATITGDLTWNLIKWFLTGKS